MTISYVRKLAEVADRVGQGEDPRTTLLDVIGRENIKGFHPTYRMVLIGTYVRPSTKKITRTDGSVVDFQIGGDKTRTEDRFQSPVGLVLKLGPGCFDGPQFRGFSVEVGDFVFFKVSDSHELFFVDQKTQDGSSARVIADDLIFGKIDDPKTVY